MVVSHICEAGGERVKRECVGRRARLHFDGARRRDAPLSLRQRVTGTNEPQITENCRSSMQPVIRCYLHAEVQVSTGERPACPYPLLATIIGLVYNCRNSRSRVIFPRTSSFRVPTFSRAATRCTRKKEVQSAIVMLDGA